MENASQRLSAVTGKKKKENDARSEMNKMEINVYKQTIDIICADNGKAVHTCFTASFLL